MYTHGISAHDTRGFALAGVVLALIGLTGLALAGYLRSNTDYRINANHRAALHAFNVADAGRSNFMARGKIRLDTVAYTYTDGDADVWLTPLLIVDDSSNLFRLSTVGQHSSPEGLASRRTLNSIVLHKAAGFSVNAAFTAANGLLKNGTSGDVDGHDFAAAGACSVAATEDVAGLAVPPAGFFQSGGKGGTGTPTGFAGNPPIDDTQSAIDILNATGIDWQGLLDGSYAQADYIVSQDGYPNFSGGAVPSDEWPLILADYSAYTVGSNESGRGTLVVQGNLTIGGNFRWDGLLLVGGTITSNGIERVDGAAITGLNILVGGSPGVTDLGNGNWNYHYDSCNVLNALKAIGWPVEEPGTWTEVF
ncbi:MAG: hypothetical protein R3195_05730 [Gemmatimonadota bacterium]|nr:hypothetical protein [Gemmatimonadota bacterium]